MSQFSDCVNFELNIDPSKMQLTGTSCVFIWLVDSFFEEMEYI